MSNNLDCHNCITDEHSAMFQIFFFQKRMEKFCNLNRLTGLIKKPTCFKDPNKPAYIDLILTK